MLPRRVVTSLCSVRMTRQIIDGFTRFIAAALDAADAAIALVTDSHRTRLLQELRTRGVDIDGAIERGTCLSFDADVAPDPVRFVRRSTVCVRPPPKPGKHIPASLFAGNVRDGVGRRPNGRGGSARTTLWRTGPRRRHSVRVSGAVHERQSGAHAHLRGAHRGFCGLAA